MLSVSIFSTNKFTQCKTSSSLKIDVFEITDNKNIAKLFSKYELLLFDQANFSSDPSQTLILRFCMPRASNNLHMFFIGSPILSCPIQPNATTSIGYTKPCSKPSQSNLLSSCLQIIIPYVPGTLSIKKLSL